MRWKEEEETERLRGHVFDYMRRGRFASGLVIISKLKSIRPIGLAGTVPASDVESTEHDPELHRSVLPGYRSAREQCLVV